jgi:hypothetical protein
VLGAELLKCTTLLLPPAHAHRDDTFPDEEDFEPYTGNEGPTVR